MDILFLLHTSADIGDDNLQRQIRFVSTINKKLKVAPLWARVGLISYNSNATLVASIGQYSDSESLNGVMNTLTLGGPKTNLNQALGVAASEIFRHGVESARDVPKIVVILVADKESPSPNGSPAGLEAENLSSRGVNVFVVGIGATVDQKELELLVKSDNELILAKEFTELVPRTGQLLTRICKATSK